MVVDSFSVYSWYSVFAFVWNRFDGDGLWFCSGRYRTDGDVIEGLTQPMKLLGVYL